MRGRRRRRNTPWREGGGEGVRACFEEERHAKRRTRETEGLKDGLSDRLRDSGKGGREGGRAGRRAGGGELKGRANKEDEKNVGGTQAHSAEDHHSR